MTIYTFIESPGHGWLKVSYPEVKESGFKASPFSWAEGDIAYLEEDLDMPGFLRARFGDHYRNRVVLATVQVDEFGPSEHAVRLGS